tara:strand:+ start:747 stop:1346 length:600 start_codon:yes stop_codon:yes gene_type:complete
MKFGIIKYSSSNTGNVKRLFRKVFKDEILEINNINDKSDILILPGVGNFEFVMNELIAKKFDKAFLYKNFKRIFGICLGMHLLQKCSSECESGFKEGFSFGKKEVIPISSNQDEKRVHTGWNYVKFINKKFFILDGYYFFSHSFGILWTGESDEIAYYEINNKKFVAVFKKDNFTGVQFHPELSGEKGRELISFLVKIK